MGNFSSSFNMIATDHSDLQMSFITYVFDGTFDVWSKTILETECSKESKVNLFIIESLLKDVG